MRSRAEFWVEADSNRSGIFIRCTEPEEDRRRDLATKSQHLGYPARSKLWHPARSSTSPRPGSDAPRRRQSGTPLRSSAKGSSFTVVLNLGRRPLSIIAQDAKLANGKVALPARSWHQGRSRCPERQGRREVPQSRQDQAALSIRRDGPK